jgi:hypothetical protein
VTDRSAFGQSVIRLDVLSEHHPMLIEGLAAWIGSDLDELNSLKWTGLGCISRFFASIDQIQKEIWLTVSASDTSSPAELAEKLIMKKE